MMMNTFTWDTFTELQPVPGPVLGDTGDRAQWSRPQKVRSESPVIKTRILRQRNNADLTRW